MKALIGCEESQAVCIEFRKLGHEAYSCDLQPCSGGHPEWHLEGDAISAAKSQTWDLVISFPPCTHLAVSGARWFDKKRLSGEQYEGVKFFLDIYELSNVTENPIGIMNGGEYVRKWFPDLHEYGSKLGLWQNKPQIIQPWQFGHGETKATCIWLKGVSPLAPTNITPGRDGRIWKMPPSPDRAKLRSKTYPGIAKAMAETWGKNTDDTHDLFR